MTRVSLSSGTKREGIDTENVYNVMPSAGKMSKIKDDPQKMWKRRIIDMELNYHARPIQRNVGLSR
ncbi:hypothetical protein TNCV_2440191, partial [Trichonephila clavipes]